MKRVEHGALSNRLVQHGHNSMDFFWLFNMAAACVNHHEIYSKKASVCTSEDQTFTLTTHETT
jgi:hypothetical protein